MASRPYAERDPNQGPSNDQQTEALDAAGRQAAKETQDKQESGNAQGERRYENRGEGYGGHGYEQDEGRGAADSKTPSDTGTSSTSIGAGTTGSSSE